MGRRMTMDYHGSFRATVSLEKDYKHRFELQSRTIADLKAKVRDLEKQIASNNQVTSST